VKETIKENQEITCCKYFLDWYNKQHKRSYTCEKATERFPELNKNNQGDWDFVACERDNPKLWLAIEVKGLPHLMETSLWFEFWRRLCLKLTKDLESKGIKGQFEISVPPVLDIGGKRQRLVDVFSHVLIEKQSGWRVGETKDIGPDVWSKFPNWPTQKSDVDEWDEWGRDRPSKLEITKVSDSGCEVRVVTGPLITDDVVEAHKKAFNEVFKLKNGLIQPDRQLERAKEWGARKTILLLAGIGVDEGLTKNYLQNLDHHLISHIDCIYLVDMGNKDRVVKMYPS